MLRVVALFLLVALTYIPAMGCGFIWDDDDYVTENPTLRSADGLRRIWLEPRATPQYYPLVHTTLWLEYHLWGLAPAGYHLVNVVLHAANAVLVWLVLSRMGVPGAWLAAALFGLHPVHVESVAWVTERKNVLSGLFYLLALLAYVDIAQVAAKPVEKQRRPVLRYAAATMLFVAALLSKSVVCSLPAAILLLILWRHQRLTWKDVGLLLPWFALGLLFALNTADMEKKHVGAVGAAFAWSFAERCLIAGHALCFYIGKLAWPHPLVFMYPRWTINTANVSQWLYVAMALAVPTGLFVMRRRCGYGPAVAALFFIGTLFPALGFFNVYPMRYSFVADHFQYLASLGPIALASAAATLGWKRVSNAAAGHNRRKAIVVPAPNIGTYSWAGAMFAASVLGVLTVLSWSQQSVYRDPETLWSDVLSKNPQSGAAHFHLGKIRTAQGRAPEATRHFRDALRLQTDDTEMAAINTHLANSLVREGDVAEAQAAFHAALRQQPDFWEALNGMGNLLARQGKVAPAIDFFERALAAAPGKAAVHQNLANALAAGGNLDAAERHYRESIRLDPQFVPPYLNLGNLLARQNRLAEAEDLYSAALRIDPHLEQARQNLERVRAARRG